MPPQQQRAQTQCQCNNRRSAKRLWLTASARLTQSQLTIISIIREYTRSAGTSGRLCWLSKLLENILWRLLTDVMAVCFSWRRCLGCRLERKLILPLEESALTLIPAFVEYAIRVFGTVGGELSRWKSTSTLHFASIVCLSFKSTSVIALSLVRLLMSSLILPLKETTPICLKAYDQTSNAASKHLMCKTSCCFANLVFGAYVVLAPFALSLVGL